MAYADNIMNTTQSFLTPDYIKKLSSVLGQPMDKVQSSLRTVLPTFLLGLFNKGSSAEGADSIVKMVQTSSFDNNSLPENINDTSYLQKGENVVNNIFGSNLGSVTNTLGTSTGLGSSGIQKMMGLIAPIVMGVVGTKVKSERLNATGLAGFFRQQKSLVSSLMPSSLATLVGVGGVKSFTKSGRVTAERSKPMGSRWGLLALLALLLIGFFYWFAVQRFQKIVTEPNQTEAAKIQPAPTQPSAAPVSLGQLGAFLASPNAAELPKRFNFENLSFATGTVSLSSSSTAEIDQIAAAMKQYPNVTARIEGFTDNVGNPGINQTLSDGRAMVVRDMIIGKGIDPSRLEATGRGQDAPIAPNETEEGRAKNRRIEFVITGLK